MLFVLQQFTAPQFASRSPDGPRSRQLPTKQGRRPQHGNRLRLSHAQGERHNAWCRPIERLNVSCANTQWSVLRFNPVVREAWQRAIDAAPPPQARVQHTVWTRLSRVSHAQADYFAVCEVGLLKEFVWVCWYAHKCHAVAPRTQSRACLNTVDCLSACRGDVLPVSLWLDVPPSPPPLSCHPSSLAPATVVP